MNGLSELDDLLDAEHWAERGQPQRGDEARLDAMVDTALGLVPPPGGGGAAANGAAASRSMAMVAATIVVVAAVAAWMAWPRADDAVVEAPVARAATESVRTPLEPPIAPPSSSRSPVGAPVAASAAVPTPDEQPVADLPPTQAEPAAPVARLDAATLLRLAGEARDAGRIRTASRLYARLFREHPRSREATTGRVSAGRLELDARGRAAAALLHFDRYLRDEPDGILAEEAMLGRALARGRQGRTAAELQAWTDLLDRFPASLHASRARARVDAIASGGP
ncbi:MAG: hypothetical protein K0V04_06750 [Deltaproteobacteria bacterium]|nr:hypothetical protein [Deltaproteobacteria bacterium]